MRTDGEDRAGAHLRIAQDYERAASAVLQAEGGSRAFWMLVSHAMELGLKSHLLHVGVDEADLIERVNHSLTAALRMAEASGGARTDGEIVGLIESVSRPHAMQAFRYPSLLPETELPPPDRALRTLERFLENTEAGVRGWWRGA